MDVDSLRIEDFYPILVPNKNWYWLGHSNIEDFVLTKRINSLEAKQYSNSITDFLWDTDRERLLEFLEAADGIKLWKLYLLPELKRLIENIDFTNEHTILQSFAGFFRIKFELEWNSKKRQFESHSSSHGEPHYELIFNFCDLKFNTFDFEAYFEKEYHDRDTIARLVINRKHLKELYRKVKDTIPKKTRYYRFREEEITTYEIDLCQFLESSENCRIVADVGMTHYISKLIKDLKQLIKSKPSNS